MDKFEPTLRKTCDEWKEQVQEMEEELPNVPGPLASWPLKTIMTDSFVNEIDEVLEAYSRISSKAIEYHRLSRELVWRLCGAVIVCSCC